MAYCINNKHLYNWILKGSDEVYLNKESLNAANAFPVPDRDTGNNLSYMMKNIVKDIKFMDSIKDMFDHVVNAAIIGARGNSGAIFSQFFNGFYSGLPTKSFITIDELYNCFLSGYEYSYRSIQNPKEGTVITVIRSWANNFKKNLNLGLDIVATLNKSLEQLKDDVKTTANTIKNQRKIKSADAGAKAFFYLINALIDVLNYEILDYSSIIGEEKVDFEGFIDHNGDFDHDEKYRYCAEVLVEKRSGIEATDIKRQFDKSADSIVVSDNEKYLKLHLHTNTPSEVVEYMEEKAEVLEVKADDMIYQKRLSHLNPGKIALVIDSVADIPIDMLEDFVHVLPINVMVGEVSYQDKLTAYSALVEKRGVSTSQPNLLQVKNFLRPIMESYDGLVYLSVSSKLSGIYNRVETAIRELDFKKPIYLIDSKQNSVAQGLVAYKAMKLIDCASGIDELESIAFKIAQSAENTKIYVSLKNLNRMIASGRLSSSIGNILRFINYLPLITLDKRGGGRINGLAFSRKRNKRLLLNKLIKNKDKIENYAIVHADSPLEAKELADKAKHILGMEPLYIDKISTAVLQYSGIGSVAIGYELKGRRR